MKSNVPWSVKGIERDARETAKAAAHREGMTVGEWLNQVIYTAGDPNAEPTEGAIEGLRARDLASAIEHLSKRISTAEAKSTDAVDNLARSLGGAVERLQRLERSPASEGAAEFSQRLETLEAKSADRQRIDALRALEKAVSQVAVQFSQTQETTGARLDTAEKRLQALADKLDAGASSEGVSADTVREAFDSMAERIDRAEKIAREAAALKAEASGSADADFVQKTGIRLRILGDEIKRSGDQIKTLEGTIARLGDQIDAAERRSAEGVQKVAETIADLRTQFASGDAPGDASARAEIEAAIADITERTEGRIEALQQSFDAMVRRLDNSAAEPERSTAMRAAERAAPAAIQSLQIAPEPALDTPSDFDFEAKNQTAEAPSEIDFDAELEEAFGALDAPQDEAESTDEDAATLEFEEEPAPAPQPIETEDDDFSFDLDDAPAAKSDEPELDNETNEVLSEIREAFGIDAAPEIKEPEPQEEESEDEARAETVEAASDEPPPVIADAAPAETEAQPQSQGDYLKAARQAAREAAAKAAAEADSGGRRKLTPKQRAILAARVKRRRMEEEQQRLAVAASVEEAAAVSADEEEDEEKPSMKARVLAAVARMKSRGKKDEDDAQISGEPSLDADEDEEKPSNPNIMSSAAAALNGVGGTSVSRGVLIIGAIILLLGAALFFFAKDLLIRSAPKRPARAPAEQSAPVNPQPAAADAAIADTAVADTTIADPTSAATAPAVRDGANASAATDTLIRPRELYLDNIEALKTAQTDAQARAALAKIEQAAALGHPPAQLQIGELYKIGQIYPKDLSKARLWFERAANGGNVLAMHRLGVMAARGEGGPVSPETSISWFEKAASYGLVDSEYNLGATYHPTPDGASNGVQNAALAYYWYSIAAKNGDAQAAEMAAGIANSLTPAEKADKDAEIAAWAPQTPDPLANENSPAQ
ncbi:MAG: hypothetical protein R3C60_02520 [Parvularculaceae bacterium]